MTPDARAARERKQKIFVAVGGLLLLGMLAFQLPKLLGGSPSSSPEAAAATTVAGITVPNQLPSTLPPSGSTATPVGSPTATRVATAAKLTSFTLFAPKDPFVQQAVVDSAVADAAAAGPGGGGKGAASETPAQEFTTGPQAALMTVIKVNGARQALEPGMKFPVSDPMFVLVGEQPGAKSVVVGIAGGAYAGGARTTTLKVGKPLTLVNTSTGARYKITLVSVGSGDQALGAKPKQ